jgi:hypothetical protein
MMKVEEACKLLGDDGKTIEVLCKHQGFDMFSTVKEYVTHVRTSFGNWFNSFPPSWRSHHSKRKVLTSLNKMAALPDTDVAPEEWQAMLQQIQQRIAQKKVNRKALGKDQGHSDDADRAECQGNKSAEQDSADATEEVNDIAWLRHRVHVLTLMLNEANEEAHAARQRQDGFAAAVADYMEAYNPGMGRLLIDFYRAGSTGGLLQSS